jgi:hypothetical protein
MPSQVKKADGKMQDLDLAKIEARLNKLTFGLNEQHVSVKEITQKLGEGLPGDVRGIIILFGEAGYLRY